MELKEQLRKYRLAETVAERQKKRAVRSHRGATPVQAAKK